MKPEQDLKAFFARRKGIVSLAAQEEGIEKGTPLAAWLDSYRINDPSETLLESIVATASALPRQKPQSFSWRAWAADAAAFACVAALGFWIGGGSVDTTTISVSTQTATIQQTSSTNEAAYLQRVIFGATSWKEVIL